MDSTTPENETQCDGCHDATRTNHDCAESCESCGELPCSHGCDMPDDPRPSAIDAPRYW